jgi:prepilin-type N-terminal cleavage/methylation domain-containing protein
VQGSHRGRRCRGFGIVEMLIAMGLSAIVMTAATRFFSFQVSAMRTERVRRGAQMTARTALNFMVRHLELLGRDPQRVLFSSLDTPALPPAIATADASEIHYRTNLSEDLDDADTLDEWEDVTFSVSDGVVWITRGVAAPLALTDASQTAASHVADDGLALTYFDGDGDEVLNLVSDAARASVRRIRVSLTVRGGGADDDSGPSVTLSQDVFLRNVS